MITGYDFMEFVLVFSEYEVLTRQERSESPPLNKKKEQLVPPVNYKASAVCCSFSQK